MRITHFSWEFPPTIWGGLGTFALEVTKKQAQLGHHVEVYAINYQNTSKENEKWNDVEVHRPKTIELHDTFLLFANNDVRSWGTHFQFFSDVVNFNITSAYNFYRNSREKTRPTDIIDGHDWLGIIGAMAAKKVISAPLVFHLHSTETGRSLGGGSQTIKHIEYEGGQQADAIITVSHAMKKELIKLGFPNKKIHVCWNGVDPDKYDSNRFSENEIDTLKKNIKLRKMKYCYFLLAGWSL
jgi:glycogen(starch) synthase